MATDVKAACSFAQVGRILSAMTDTVARLNAALEGRYAIERDLGEGGMATVYLADDLKHERKVALKVLKPELAAVVGAERFLAEIKTTANLTHPHILPLHDSGEADSFLFYVMPHIEGESLRERIDREKQLPVDEAVKIATDLAEALDYAHRHKIIHRDIKPANILIHEGRPLIADFGIALAVGVAGGGRLTETGLSVGTPHYMSPEQATGDQAVGVATDIYALGAVLYEMLIGDPPYTGSTAQAILGKIIQGKTASATEERASVPANVDAAIRKALEKLPADRFTGAQDFAGALGDEHFRYGELATAGAGGVAAGPWKRLTMVFAALAAVLTLTLGWMLLRPEAPEPPRAITRVPVLIPEEERFHPSRGDLDLSDDGSLLVYRGLWADGRGQLWAKRWNELQAAPIRGTEGGNHPAISPDGREVAFAQDGAVRVIPLEGGVPRTLAEGAAVAWSPDGVWLYFRDTAGGMSRVLADGSGSEETITRLNTAAGETGHVHMEVLPGGRKIVYHVTGPESSIQAVDLDTREIVVVTLGSYPRYSSTGHLLFLDEAATLLAAPFDMETLELTGAARPVAQQLAMIPNGMGFFAISRTERLVYLAGGAFRSRVSPVSVDRNGVAREIDPEWRVEGDPRLSSLALSPDGTRLAISILSAEGADMWVTRLDTGARSQLTFGGTTNIRPAWSLDSGSLTLVSNRAGQRDLWTSGL